MKKITALLSVFLFTLTAQAQTVDFKIEYKPNTTYTSTTSQDNKVEVGYGGEPMVQEMKSQLVNTIKVGALSNGEAPFTIELSMDASKQGAAQINGTKVTGKVKPGQVPVIENVKEKIQEAKKERIKQEEDAKAAMVKAEEDAKFRVWTSTNGKKSSPAKIVSYANGVITIENREGKRIKVPLEKLIEPDRDYVHEWRKSRTR